MLLFQFLFVLKLMFDTCLPMFVRVLKVALRFMCIMTLYMYIYDVVHVVGTLVRHQLRRNPPATGGRSASEHTLAGANSTAQKACQARRLSGRPSPKRDDKVQKRALLTRSQSGSSDLQGPLPQ